MPECVQFQKKLLGSSRNIFVPVEKASYRVTNSSRFEEEIELFDRRGNRVCASMTVITKKKA